MKCGVDGFVLRMWCRCYIWMLMLWLVLLYLGLCSSLSSCLCVSVCSVWFMKIFSSVNLLFDSVVGLLLIDSVCVWKLSRKWLNVNGLCCLGVVVDGVVWWWCSMVCMCVSNLCGLNGLLRQLFVLSLSLMMWLMLFVCVVSMIMGMLLLAVCNWCSVVRLFMFGIIRFSMIRLGCLCLRCFLSVVVLCSMDIFIFWCMRQLCSRFWSFWLLLMMRIWVVMV